MRLSTDYYPEHVDFECTNEGCWYQNYSVPVDSIEVDDVRVYCESCGFPTYVRVIED
ncbi:DNA binding protein [Microbacterium phage Cassita]|nr:DNA binding protein [Microbacterium phage Cassita]